MGMTRDLLRAAERRPNPETGRHHDADGNVDHVLFGAQLARALCCVGGGLAAVFSYCIWAVAGPVTPALAIGGVSLILVGLAIAAQVYILTTRARLVQQALDEQRDRYAEFRVQPARGR